MSGQQSAAASTSPASKTKTATTKKRKPTPEEAAFNAKLKDQSSLRFISAKVCEIVESKVTTTYNEVANELVIEALKLFEGASHTEKKKKDHEKNIRRRVYDALNVLLATDIISKTKEKGDREKSIHWKGYPTTTSVDLVLLEKEKEAAIAEIERKKECLQELLVQNVCFRNLERRNKRMKQEENNNKIKREGNDSSDGNDNSNNNGTPNTENDEAKAEEEKIYLPFIVVNTAENATIKCEMNQDKTDVMFDFNMPFEINDDNEILKRLGLSRAPYEELQKILPADILRYCHDNRLLDAVMLPAGYAYAHQHADHGHGPGPSHAPAGPGPGGAPQPVPAPAPGPGYPPYHPSPPGAPMPHSHAAHSHPTHPHPTAHSHPSHPTHPSHPPQGQEKMGESSHSQAQAPPPPSQYPQPPRY